jgi:hypothetical protein
MVGQLSKDESLILKKIIENIQMDGLTLSDLQLSLRKLDAYLVTDPVTGKEAYPVHILPQVQLICAQIERLAQEHSEAKEKPLLTSPRLVYTTTTPQEHFVRARSPGRRDVGNYRLESPQHRIAASMTQLQREIRAQKDLLSNLNEQSVSSKKRENLSKQQKQKKDIARLERNISNLASGLVALEDKERQAILERDATEARRRLNVHGYINDFGGTPLSLPDYNASIKELSHRRGIARTLLIGINYRGSAHQLRGSINDVNQTLSALRNLGFCDEPEMNLRILTEDGSRKPTHANIIDSLAWLTHEVRAGDVLYLHYIGQGPQYIPFDSAGPGRFFETAALIPMDFESEGVISSSKLHSLITGLPTGVTLFAVFDCCHSGTLLDLRHVFCEGRGAFVTDNSIAETKAMVFALSGSQNLQSAKELPENFQKSLKQSVGALTTSLLPLLPRALSWMGLISALRISMQSSRLQQIAHLEVSRRFDVTETAFQAAFASLPLPSLTTLVALPIHLPSTAVDAPCIVSVPMYAANAKARERLRFEEFLARFGEKPSVRRAILDLVAALNERIHLRQALLKIRSLSFTHSQMCAADLKEALYILIGTLALELAADAEFYGKDVTCPRPEGHSRPLTDSQRAAERAADASLLDVLTRVRDALSNDAEFFSQLQGLRRRLPELSEALAQLSNSPSVHSVHVELAAMTRLFKQTQARHEEQEEHIQVLDAEVEAMQRNIKQQQADLVKCESDSKRIRARFEEDISMTSSNQEKERVLLAEIEKLVKAQDKELLELMENTAATANRTSALKVRAENLSRVTKVQQDTLVTALAKEQELQNELSIEVERCISLRRQIESKALYLKEVEDRFERKFMSKEAENEALSRRITQLHKTHRVFAVGRAELMAAEIAHQFYRKLCRTQTASLHLARVDQMHKEDLMVGDLTAQRLEAEATDAQLKSKFQQNIANVEKENEWNRTHFLRIENETKAVEAQLEVVDSELEGGRRKFSEMLALLERDPVHSEVSSHERRFFQLLCKLFVGDYLGLALKGAVHSTLMTHRDSKVVFSDFVVKINRNNQEDKRVLMISERTICLMKPNLALSRSIRIADLESIGCSRKATNLLVLHNGVDRDLICLTPKREEVCYYLIELYYAATGKAIKFRFGEHLWVSDPGLKHRNMRVPHSESVANAGVVIGGLHPDMRPRSPDIQSRQQMVYAKHGIHARS